MSGGHFFSPWESPWVCERTQQGVDTNPFLYQGKNASESLPVWRYLHFGGSKPPLYNCQFRSDSRGCLLEQDFLEYDEKLYWYIDFSAEMR